MRTIKKFSTGYALLLLLMVISFPPLLAQTSRSEDTKQQEFQEEAAIIPQEKPTLKPIPSSEITLRSEESN
jgi:hypothetical protein